MDDNRFDSDIKKRLEGYEAPGFDPAALASLHHQMAAISVTPWYVTYRTELLAGSAILLSTLLIIWSQWTFTNKSTSSLESEILTLKNQVARTSQLEQELEYLKGVKPDTIRIVQYQEQSPAMYLSLIRKIERLEASLKIMAEESTVQRELLIARFNAQQKNEEVSSINYPISPFSLSNRITPHQFTGDSKKAKAMNFPIRSDAPLRNLSAKTIKEIQKHYQKGIGFRIGPALSFSHGSFDPGDNRYNIGGGVLADFIVSPSLSIETGIVHSQRHNRISATDVLQPADFPGSDPSLGELKNVDIDSWVFEAPLGIKYRYPVSLRSNWLFGGGYSAMIYSKQILEYDYQFGSNQSASINSSMISKKIKPYPGTLNLSLGFSSELKNKKIFEASVYYQYGLGKVGIEQTTPEFFGVRGAYWFTLK